MKKPRFKTVKILVLSALLLVIVSLSGVFLFLRSKAGEKLVFEEIQKALAAQDLTLTVSSFIGPLPFKVAAKDVSLADKNGPFLTVGSLDLDIKGLALLKKRLSAAVTLDEVDLLRRPELKPKPKDKSKEPFALPLDIETQVTLTNSLIEGKAINPAQPGDQALVGLDAQVAFIDNQLTFNLDASLKDATGRGLVLKGILDRLSPNDPETFDLNLVFKDQDGFFTGPRPDLPPILTLTVLGQGPLTNWEGSLALVGSTGSIANETAEPQKTALVTADLKFQGKTGLLFQDIALTPDYKANIELKTLAKIIPPEFLLLIPELGPLDPESPLVLIAKVTAQDKEFSGQLSALNPLVKLNSPAFNLAFKDSNLAINFEASFTPGEMWRGNEEPINLVVAARNQEDIWEINHLDLTSFGFSAIINGQVGPVKQIVSANIKVEEKNALYPLLSKIAPTAPQPGAFETDLSLTREVKSGQLTANGDLKLANLSPLAPGWEGPIKADYKVKGLIKALDFELSLTSPKLNNPSGPFTDLDLFLRGQYQNNSPNTHLKADLKAKATNPKAPLDLTAKVDLAVSPGDFSLDLSGFNLSAPGVSAQSDDLKLAVKPGEPPLVNGSLTAQVLDWKLLGDLTGQPLAGAPALLEIKVAKGLSPLLEASLDLPEVKLGETLALKGTSLKVTSIVAEKANLKLDLTQGPGQIGPLALKSGEIHLTGSGLWREGLMGDLKARLIGPTGDLLNLEGGYNLKDRTVALKKLLVDPPQIKGSLALTREARLDLQDGVSFSDLAFSLSQGGRINLTGHTGGVTPLTAKVEATGLPLNLLSEDIFSGPNGQVDLKANYNNGRGGYELKTVLAGPPILTLTSKGELVNGSLKGEAKLTWPSSPKPIQATFQAPFKATGDLVEPNPSGPLIVDAAFRGPASRLWLLTGQEDMALKGEVDLKVKVTGSLAQPKTALTAYLVKGGFQDPATGLTLTGLNFSGQLDEKGEIKLLAEARDGGHGRLGLEGTISPKASPPSLKARVQLDHLSPLHRDDLVMTVSALATLEGPLTALKLTAQAVVEKAEISLAQGFGGPAVKTLEIGDKENNGGSPLDLDLTIDFPNQFYIRGRGLDSEWRGRLRLTGSASSPMISGYIQPVRGYLELLAKQFTIAQGEIRFYESTVINPSLNLELTRQASEVLAMIRVSGTKDSPRVSLESQPPRPPDEILAQILFGKSSSQLSRVETLQLANSLRTLTGIGPKMDLLTPLNTVRDTLGLSVLRVGETSTGNDQRILKGNSFRENLNLDNDRKEESTSQTTIEAGKYLSERVYVGLEQNLGQNSTGVRVEVELTPSVNLESKTTTRSSRVGLGWKKDY
ncbi:MAG: translocation/assembly module TamB domain-containing protein [Deltaproteobacteria bacterium]|jgi:translocation and assembly module TamB|nr:translocation/assembly module TamB domain-containing protein [Deltaproteobacteria bacterium]